MAAMGRQRGEIVNIPDFWLRLGNSQTRLLALDYDGTLAPFHLEPMKAFPLPGTQELLAAINETGATRLAIISGRPLQELATLLGDLEITMIGSHGFETRGTDGEIIVENPSPIQLEGLEKASEMARRMGAGHKLEIKVASVAFHTRGMDPDLASHRERQLINEWSALTSPYALECRRFNGGVEIRSLGVNKGDSILALVGEQPCGSFNVYLGDDETDEDAFRKLSEGSVGYGIKVGDPSVPSAAAGFLTDCEGVRSFLETWLEITSGKSI